MTNRRRIGIVVSALSVLAVAGAVQAQFVPPTCTPPDCNPQVIQNITLAGTPQTASFNITGDGGVGAKLEAGRQAPTFAAATDYLFYGNVNAASTAGYLMLLQTGGADRLKVSLLGQLQLPLGTAAAPSYTFLGDTNTGFFSSAADSMSFVTNGVARTIINNNGTTINSGTLRLPAGSAAAPSLTFSADTNTGLFSGGADIINVVTGGVTRINVDATGLVTIPGSLTVGGVLTASGGLGGDGSAITNLNASNITTGTLADGRLSPNVPLLNADNVFTGNNTFSGMTSLGSASLVVGAGQNMVYGVADNTSTGNLVLLQSESGGVYTDEFRVAANGDTTVGGNVTATAFIGNGASLTNLNASNLTSGTVPSARLSGTYANSLTFSNRTSFGSATLVVAAGQNLLYGNVDTTSAGNLLLLQNESADRFRVDAAGNLVLSGTITSGGQGVCLADGTNCPPAVEGSGTLNYVAKFTPDGGTVGNSQIFDNGTNVGIANAGPSYKLDVTGSGRFSGVIATNGATPDANYGVLAGNTSTFAAVRGDGFNYGVYGTAANAGGSIGVYGAGPDEGVRGHSTAGTFAFGVVGTLTAVDASSAAVAGFGGSGSARGVYGVTTGSGIGVFGLTTSSGAGGSFQTSSAAGTGLIATGFGAGKALLAQGDVQFNNSLNVTGVTTLGSTLTLGSLGGDPAGANGMEYYNTTTGKFRCYEAGAWKDCVTAASPSVWSTINAPAGTDPVPDAALDTLNLTAGAGVSIIGDATTDTITVANTGDTNAADDITGLTAGAGISVSGSAPTLTITNTGDANAADDVTGSGSANYLPKFTGASSVGNSIVYDTGTNLGISNAAPSYKLDVTGNARVTGPIGTNGYAPTGGWGITTGGTSYGGVFYGGSYGVYGSGSSYAFYGSGNAYISGNLGVGAGPTRKLDVRGDARIDGPIYIYSSSGPQISIEADNVDNWIRFWDYGASWFAMGFDQSANTFSLNRGSSLNSADFVMRYDFGYVGIGRNPTANRLEVNGAASKTSAGDWLANSDRRIKTDVESLTGALDVVNRLRPVKFRYSDAYAREHGIEDKEYFNFIAQEYQDVFPGYVKDGGDTFGDVTGILQIDSYPAQVYAIKAIQEQQEEIEDLKDAIEDLERRLKALEER